MKRGVSCLGDDWRWRYLEADKWVVKCSSTGETAMERTETHEDTAFVE